MAKLIIRILVVERIRGLKATTKLSEEKIKIYENLSNLLKLRNQFNIPITTKAFPMRPATKMNPNSTKTVI